MTTENELASALAQLLDAVDRDDICLDDQHRAREALAGWQPLEPDATLTSAVACLREIAAMGKKAGSETAKHWLTMHGIDWETGDVTPDYGSMT